MKYWSMPASRAFCARSMALAWSSGEALTTWRTAKACSDATILHAQECQRVWIMPWLHTSSHSADLSGVLGNCMLSWACHHAQNDLP